jgi:hypothetical protein
MIIHAYYNQHDVYDIPDEEWKRALDENSGDEDAALQGLFEAGIEPADGDSTGFYMEAEK